MLEKFTKDHPIVVVGYYQWLVSNYGINESMNANVMVTKPRDKLDELSSSTASAVKIINELKNSFASEKKATDTPTIKLSTLVNNRRYSEAAGVQGGCTPEEEPVLTIKEKGGGDEGVLGENSAENTIDGTKGGRYIDTGRH